MLRLDHDQGTARFEHPHQRVRDLAGHPLLHLRPPGVDVNQPRQLGQTGDLALLVRYVGHVGGAEERHQVMLTRAVDLDVADQDQLVVVGVEHGAQHVLRVLGQPGELFRVGTGHPRRGIDQPVPVRVLPDSKEDFPYSPLDPRQVYRLGQSGSPGTASSEPNGSAGGVPPPSEAAPLDWPLPVPGVRSLPSEAAVRASSLGVSTGGRSEGSRLP